MTSQLDHPLSKHALDEDPQEVEELDGPEGPQEADAGSEDDSGEREHAGDDAAMEDETPAEAPVAGQDAKKYHCAFEGCGKAFSQKSTLVSHNRLHTEVDPFKCPIQGCGTVTTSPSALNAHKRRKHPSEGSPVSKKRLQKNQALEGVKRTMLAKAMDEVNAHILLLEAKRSEVASELEARCMERDGLIQLIAYVDGKTTTKA